VVQMANGTSSSPGLQRMITAAARPILVILMPPEEDIFPIHAFTPAKGNYSAAMGTNGVVRSSAGGWCWLLIVGGLGHFHLGCSPACFYPAYHVYGRLSVLVISLLLA